MSPVERRDARCMVEYHGGRGCPYVDGGDIWHLIAERDHLSQRMEEIDIYPENCDQCGSEVKGSGA